MQQDMCDPNATFTPAFNQRSLRLAEARRTKAGALHLSMPEAAGGTAGGRAARAASCGPTRRGSPSPQPAGDRRKAPADAEACTFRPAVNEATDAHLNRAGIPATFMERQSFYEQRRRVRSLPPRFSHLPRPSHQSDGQACPRPHARRYPALASVHLSSTTHRPKHAALRHLVSS